MPISHAARSRALVAALSILVVACAAVATASASNMAFKMNKVIYVLGTPPQGQNLVSLPYRNPYQGPGGTERLCTALGLSSTAQITQFDGVGNIRTHTCGNIPQFDLMDGKGVMILEPGGTRSGIIVGSHVPGMQFTLEDLGTSPIGINLLPNLYHATAVTPQDLCSDCGLSTTTTISRFDANTGQILSHTCGGIPQWNLVLGEALLVLEDNGPKNCVQSHF